MDTTASFLRGHFIRELEGAGAEPAGGQHEADAPTRPQDSRLCDLLSYLHPRAPAALFGL